MRLWWRLTHSAFLVVGRRVLVVVVLLRLPGRIFRVVRSVTGVVYYGSGGGDSGGNTSLRTALFSLLLFRYLVVIAAVRRGLTVLVYSLYA